MLIWFLITIFVISTLGYILYSSYKFQIYYRNKKRKKQILELQNQTRGEYISTGYFSSEHKIVEKKEYKKLLKRQKAELSLCYSILKFKTVDADWEIFFNLIKESGQFKEFQVLKCYPHNKQIHSKLAAEKINHKIELFSSNHNLMRIFSSQNIQENLNYLIKTTDDILNIGPRYMQLKSQTNLKQTISKTKTMHTINHINQIKQKVYHNSLGSY